MMLDQSSTASAALSGARRRASFGSLALSKVEAFPPRSCRRLSQSGHLCIFLLSFRHVSLSHASVLHSTTLWQLTMHAVLSLRDRLAGAHTGKRHTHQHGVQLFHCMEYHAYWQVSGVGQNQNMCCHGAQDAAAPQPGSH